MRAYFLFSDVTAPPAWRPGRLQQAIHWTQCLKKTPNHTHWDYELSPRFSSFLPLPLADIGKAPEGTTRFLHRSRFLLLAFPPSPPPSSTRSAPFHLRIQPSTTTSAMSTEHQHEHHHHHNQHSPDEDSILTIDELMDLESSRAEGNGEEIQMRDTDASREAPADSAALQHQLEQGEVLETSTTSCSALLSVTSADAKDGTPATAAEPAKPLGARPPWYFQNQDWLSVWMGLVSIIAVIIAGYAEGPISDILPGNWTDNPLNAWQKPVTYKADRDRVGGFVVLVVFCFSVICVAFYILARFGGYKLCPTCKKGRRCSCPQNRAPNVFRRAITGITTLSALALLARWVSKEAYLEEYGFSTEFWAIMLGLIIGNSVGTLPAWLITAKEGEFFIKVGLVLLGTDLQVLVTLLGWRGLIASWLVTPIVVAFGLTMVFKVFKVGKKPTKKSPTPATTAPTASDGAFPEAVAAIQISSRTDNNAEDDEDEGHQEGLATMVVCGASVCGGSAAAAIKPCVFEEGKGDEDLSFAIALINIMTIPQMIGLPYLAHYAGIPFQVAAAWFGGTIDATGAVVAAGRSLDTLDNTAETSCADNSTCAGDIASTVKIIQNILIGLIAVAVSYWWHMRKRRLQQQQQQKDDSDDKAAKLSFLDTLAGETSTDDDTDGSNAPIKPATECPKPTESTGQMMWRTFPKFVLGFFACSIILTIIGGAAGSDDDTYKAIRRGVKSVSSWFFTLGFVGIGLDSNFRKMLKKLKGGKIIGIYLSTQIFDLLLTLAFAYFAFDLFKIPETS